MWKPWPYVKVARNAVLSDLEYRSSYYILFVASWITVAMELALFQQIYAGRDEVAGLPVALVPSFIVLGMFLRYGSSLWGLMADSIEQIRNGNFRRFLLQPVHYPSYFFAQAIGPKLPTWTLCTIAIVTLRFFPSFEPLLPPERLLTFLGAILLSFFLTWQIYLLIVYLGFWIEEAQFLSIAFNIGLGILSGSLLPLHWLPPAVVSVLRWTPLPLLGDFPIRTGLGLLEHGEYERFALHSLGWIVGLVPLLALIYRRATRRYESFGG